MSKIYLTSQQIYEQWKVWKETGNITEEFGRQMKLLSENILKHPNFNGYSKQDKEDMGMEMCEKMIRNLKNMKEQNKKSFFSYLNGCCFCAAYTFLRKHYKELNRKREMLLKELEEQQVSVPTPQTESNIRKLKELVAQFDDGLNGRC